MHLFGEEWDTRISDYRRIVLLVAHPQLEIRALQRVVALLPAPVEPDGLSLAVSHLAPAAMGGGIFVFNDF